AAMRSIAAVHSAVDRDIVFGVLRVIYEPWLDRLARQFQQAVVTSEYPVPDRQGVVGTDNECIFFVDALRLDVGKRLGAHLEQKGFVCAMELRWSALPSVTPTAKHAVSPVAAQLSGRTFNDDFLPSLLETAEPLHTNRFRKLLQENGYQVLLRNDVGTGSGRAWAEHGEVDHKGHEQGWKLALRIDELVDELAQRVEALLEAGWHRVKLVTDH